MTFQLEGAKGTLPVSIGVEGEDGMRLALLEAGTRLPANFSKVFTTTESFQMSAYFHLVLGERPLVADCDTLCIVKHDEGSFRSAGKPRYRLSVRVDGKGRIAVASQNLDHKGKDSALISYPQAVIGSDTIRRLRADAQEHALLDASYRDKYRRLDEVRTQVNKLHSEIWPIARKKMSFTEKRGYKQCRRNLQAVVAAGPAKLDEAQSARLAGLLEELEKWKGVLDTRTQQVMAWYR